MRAFIRRDGCHCTSVAPQQNWNEQFLEGANDIVREQWSALLAKQEKLSEKLLEELSDLVRSIKQSVKGKPRWTAEENGC